MKPPTINFLFVISGAGRGFVSYVERCIVYSGKRYVIAIHAAWAYPSAYMCCTNYRGHINYIFPEGYSVVGMHWLGKVYTPTSLCVSTFPEMCTHVTGNTTQWKSNVLNICPYTTTYRTYSTISILPIYREYP